MKMPHSLRLNIFFSFLLLAAALGAVMAIAAYRGANTLGEYLVERQATAVMSTLIEAEMSYLKNRDILNRNSFESGELASALGWKFLVGKEISPDMKAQGEGLHFSNDSFLLIKIHNGIIFALEGKLGEYSGMRANFGGLLWTCAIFGLTTALFLAFILSRQLTRPLERLNSSLLNHDSQAKGMQAWAPDVPGLPDEIQLLARAIAERDARLMQLMEQEMNFSGDVSHELRTPFTILRGCLELLEIRGNSSPGISKITNRMAGTMGEMENILNTLLVLSRSPENLESRECDLASLAFKIVDETRAEILKKKDLPDVGASPEISATISQHVYCRANEALAAIVFRNLLENACHYSEDGIVAFLLNEWRLEIRNTGAIPADLDIFARGSKSSRSPGCGLGLSIARRAAEKQGWRIERQKQADENIFRVYFCQKSAREG